METTEIEDLDAAGALCAFGDLRRARAGAERDIFVLAGHFADLYNVDSLGADDLASPTLPGTERPIRVAGEGAPLVREFAIAEAAVELGTTCYATKLLIGDALECRHRLPKLYARVVALEVEVWLARKVAQATRGLTPAQAALVDDALAGVADGRVSVRQFLDLLDAAVIAADPEAAAERERSAAEEEFAKVGQTNEHGRKTLYVKTSAAEMVRIEATIAHLADALRTLGDRDPLDRRRTKAVLILANPVEALKLMQALTTHHAGQGTDQGAGDHTGGAGAAQGDRGAGPFYDHDETRLPEPADDDPPVSDAADTTPVDEGCSDITEPGTQGCRGCACGGHHDPPAGDGPMEPFLRRFRPDDLPACPCRGGTYVPAWDKLLPSVTLYLHLDGGDPTDSSWEGRGIGAGGVCRWEGEGPISASYVRDFLGPYARFDIRPVIDLDKQTPTLAYEVRGRLREAVHLRSPGDVFPFATSTSRSMDIDHTEAYQHGDVASTAHGDIAGPGQTRTDNLGPMTRFHHRVKTHAPGWDVKQPFPGIYLWKSPHGSIFLVDHTGTRQIRRPHHTNLATPSDITPRDITVPGPNGRPQPADLFWDLINTAA